MQHNKHIHAHTHTHAHTRTSKQTQFNTNTTQPIPTEPSQIKPNPIEPKSIQSNPTQTHVKQNYCCCCCCCFALKRRQHENQEEGNSMSDLSSVESFWLLESLPLSSSDTSATLGANELLATHASNDAQLRMCRNDAPALLFACLSVWLSVCLPAYSYVLICLPDWLLGSEWKYR